MSERKEYYSPLEVAKMFNVVLLTVYRWIKSGRLHAEKVGRDWRITKEDIEGLIDEQRKRGKTYTRE